MTCARESFVKQSLPLHIGRAKCRHELTITSRLPGIVRMEDALIEIDKRIYFGLVEDGCGWIENSVGFALHQSRVCRDQNVVGGGQ